MGETRLGARLRVLGGEFGAGGGADSVYLSFEVSGEFAVASTVRFHSNARVRRQPLLSAVLD